MSKIKDVVIDEMNRLRELECEEVLVQNAVNKLDEEEPKPDEIAEN